MLAFARARTGSLLLLSAISAGSGLSGTVSAQAPPPSFEVDRRVDSGWVENRGDQEATIASFPVRVAGASWMRLAFDRVELPARGARLRMTSVLDGGQQELDLGQVREWGWASAYFNGDDVQVEIVAAPNTGRCRVVLSRITAGIPPIPSFSQCDSTDDRVPSWDARMGRSMPIGCSAWMINDCSHNFLTAGHCSGPTLQLVEFNVPLSNGNGAVNHPPPEDQYAVDVGSKQWMNGGVGQDWGYFGVFPNPGTGLRPFQRQQTTYVLAADAPVPSGSIVIRVTGYGTDTTPAQQNQIQQSDTGPYASLNGTTIGYRADTEGGNSGSPVLWDQDGRAIGIHTHGGCTASGGANLGTAIGHPDLQAAIANPLGQCACRGESNRYCTGKVNSQGCLEEISATGTPSVTGGVGSFVIHGSQILNGKLGLLFYGYAPASTPFHGGIACIGAPMRRTPVQDSGGNGGAPDCSGTFDYDMGARIGSLVDSGLVLGANVFAQYFSRDPASSSGAYGLTDALQFTIGP